MPQPASSSPSAAPTNAHDAVLQTLRAAGVGEPAVLAVTGADGDAPEPGATVHLAVAADAQGAAALASAVASGAGPWVCALPDADGDRAHPAPAALTKVLAAGYVPAYHDGTHLFLVDGARRASLLPLVAPSRDDAATSARVAELEGALGAWRERALDAWATTAADLRTTGQARDAVARELHDIKRSLSWRVTAPLRLVRPLVGRIVRAVRR